MAAIGGPIVEQKTMVVVPSVSLEFPPELVPVLPAYEERYLFLLLLLAQPRAVVIYLTAQPIYPRIVDYFLALIPPPMPGPPANSASRSDRRPFAAPAHGEDPGTAAHHGAHPLSDPGSLARSPRAVHDE